MPQRNSTLEKPKTPTLRRSPRFLSPKTPDINPNNTHLRRISSLTSSPPKFKTTSSTKPNKNVPNNCSKSSGVLKDSNNLSEDCAKLRNGSKKKSNSGNKIVKKNGAKGCRKLSRKVSSSVDVHMINESVKCNTRSKRKSSTNVVLAVVNDELSIDNVACPVTPIGFVEKPKGGFRNDYFGKMIETCGGMLENSERRITRSCSKLMAMNVGGRRVEEDDSKGFDDVSGDRVGGCEMRASDKPDRIARGRRNAKGNGDSSIVSVVRALKMGKFDCATPRNSKGRRSRMKDEHEKVEKTDSFCGGEVQYLNRRITRSASKRMAGELSLCEQNEERRSTCTPRVLRMVDCDSQIPCDPPGNRNGKQSRMKDNQEKVGNTDDLCVEIDRNLNRRITRSVSKRMAEETDLYGPIVERRSLCTPRALRMVECDSLSPSVTPEKGNGRHHGMKDKLGMLGRPDDSSVEMVQNLNMRVTRSASKKEALRGQNEGRRRAYTYSKDVAGLGESVMVEKQVQEWNGSSKNRKKAPRKRVQRDSKTALSSRLEAEKTSIGDVRVKEKESCVGGQDIGKVKIESCNAVSLCLTSAELEGKTVGNTEGNKVIGVKRKRKQTGLLGTHHGWTREQELALQNAYFTAKPSPHFWKRVSKLVPGKSAQDCFDKMHSDNLTPLSTRQSSRVKKQNSPSVSSYSEYAGKKSKGTRKTKHKSHLTRKAVRHLLQKSCHVNPDDGDLFSVLEPTVNPSVEAVQLKDLQLLPKNLSGTPGSHSKFLERSSSGHKNRLSRFSGIRKSPLTSPLILKKVKNMALHEKYIDQLHIRDGKRKVASARYSKLLGAQNPAQTKDLIRAAKDTLVFEAQDVIAKFRHTQANLMDAYSDSEEALNSDEGEDEVVLQ